jgi:hypothetical protein
MSAMSHPIVWMPRSVWWIVLPILAGGLLLAHEAGTATGQSGAAQPSLEKQSLAIVQAHCVRCHGFDKTRAGLDLRTLAAALRGGESGPAVTPGSPEKSKLWHLVSTDKMPQDDKKLSPAEKAILKAWIESIPVGSTVGTKPAPSADNQVTDADRRFWSFRPPVRPPVPAVQPPDLVRNPIDAFVLAALEKQGLTFAPEADRLTLLRRVSFDLIGLPPTPKQVAVFLADSRPDAYEHLIDHLLNSPHYGERWARHWLDLAGYADSEGILDADYVRSAAWRYRDYVIRALNKDTPYDRFLQEQIAGDELFDYWQAYRIQKELPPDVIEGLIATGYLRCASDTSRPDFVTIKNAPGYYFQTLDDTVKIVSSSVLGLTVQCAKCHSHKYDPIPQTDYYRLQAIFMSGYRPTKWVPQVQRRLLEGSRVQEEETQTFNKQVDAAVGRLNKELDMLRRDFGDRLFAQLLSKLPADEQEQVREAFQVEPKRRTPAQTALVKKHETNLRPKMPALAKALADAFPDYRSQAGDLEIRIKTETSKRRNLPEIRAFYDLPGEAKTFLLRRGDYLRPGPEVRPGVLSALAAPQPFDWQPPAKDAPTSGRRLALARWLTQPGHPLTVRVLVNRVWQHHLGLGLVDTPDNFGHAGGRPSHPELLDWLATEFIAQGWSLKRLHRLILTSRTYRQVSTVPPDVHARAAKIDPDNRLLWRQRLRRVEAEALRDAVLQAAGGLNPQMFGPPVPMQRRGDGEVVTAADSSGARRSIYLQVRRSQPLTFLQVFDQPVMETNCTHRDTSIVSSQALTLLNSDFMLTQARAFAERLLREQPSDPVGRAVLIAFGRPVTVKERRELIEFLEQQTGRHLKALVKAGAATAPQQQEAERRAVADLCHALLSANEFAYVD